MSLIKINDHVKQAQNRLVQQYKESVNINTLLKAIVLPIQNVEDEVDNVYRKRSIFTAEGYQLDGIGKIVGELRQGRGDSEYRIALLSRIELNISGGEPESIINAIRQLLNPTILDFIDIYPTYFQIFVQTDIFVINLPNIIRSISPTGVGSNVLIHLGNELPFVFGEVSTGQADFQMQTGTIPNIDLRDLELVFEVGNNYNLEVVVETVIEDFSGDGFAEVYLNKASFEIESNNDEYDYDLGDGFMLELDLSNANEDYSISSFGGELVEVMA